MVKLVRLTDLELKIMRVLWESDRPLTVQEIVGYLPEEKLSDASVRQSMKHLVNKKAAQVMESVLVSTVYARTFLPCYTQEEYMAAEIERLESVMYKKIKPKSLSIMAAFIQNSDNSQVDLEQISELQRLIEKKKNNLEKGKK